MYRRLLVRDAARILGISEDAVRMRVKRGTLEAEREGGRLYVLLTADPTTDPTETKTDPTPLDITALTSAKDETISELRDRVTSLERSLEEEREARRRADTIIAQLTSRIPELPAASSQEARESPETATVEPERAEPRPGTEGTQEPAERRSWWRRMFGSG
jgi:hypothetical protein